jgi:hypothetical protein
MVQNSTAVAIRDHHDETALSQLGAAAILLWSKLPNDMRAEMVPIGLKDRRHQGLKAGDGHERLARLIETNAPG